MKINDIKYIIKNYLENKLITTGTLQQKIKNKEKQKIKKELNNIYNKKFSVTELVYLLNNKNNLENLHVFCTCGNKNQFHHLTDGYYKHCSPRCSTLDPEVKRVYYETNERLHNNKDYRNFEQSQLTLQKNYNVKSPMQSKELAQRQVESCRQNWPKNNYNNRVSTKQTSQIKFNADNIWASQQYKDLYKDIE